MENAKTNESQVSSLFQELPQGAETRESRGPEAARARFKPINRQQMMMRSVDVEKLIEADHGARAIWEMLGQVDLSGFEKGIRAVEGRAGQGRISPQLLAALWIYSYSEGNSS